jgi:hypothetical protein
MGYRPSGLCANTNVSEEHATNPEDGGSFFLRSVGIWPQNYRTLKKTPLF